LAACEGDALFFVSLFLYCLYVSNLSLKCDMGFLRTPFFAGPFVVSRSPLWPAKATIEVRCGDAALQTIGDQTPGWEGVSDLVYVLLVPFMAGKSWYMTDVCAPSIWVSPEALNQGLGEVPRV